MFVGFSIIMVLGFLVGFVVGFSIWVKLRIYKEHEDE